MDWIERIEQLRRWTRNGERAPHKPLLLLYALGRYQADGGAPVRFSEAEGQLNDLLAEFGPPRRSSNLGDLRGRGAEGSLSPDLIEALNSDSHLLAQLARVLLDSNFEPSLHADICALAGLDLEAAETAAPTARTERRRRSPTFRREVLMAYEYQCAFCGYDGTLGRVSAGLDAAHVRWWAMDGPDTIDNGVCLCALHHKLFDMGVLGVTEDWRISVSSNFVGRSATARAHVLSLAGQSATPPQALYSHPKPEYITWHQHEVFKHPARMAATAS